MKYQKFTNKADEEDVENSAPIGGKINEPVAAVEEEGAKGPTAFDKVKSAVRRVVLGTSTVAYPTAAHYRTKILCIPISSFWFMVVVGVVYLADLLDQIDIAGNELIDVDMRGDMTPMEYFLAGVFLFQVTTSLALLIGLTTKRPGLLLPIRIICGFLRAIFFFHLVSAIATIFVATIANDYAESNGYYTGKSDKNKLSADICDLLMQTMILFGFYYALGLVAEAATKTAAQMKAEKKKTPLILYVV